MQRRMVAQSTTDYSRDRAGHRAHVQGVSRAHLLSAVADGYPVHVRGRVHVSPRAVAR